jgi:copper homeostasis protein
MGLLKEFCAENVEHVAEALAAGAKRIELCDNLAVGGTTPSVGVIRAAVRLVREDDAAVMVIIRPRGGDFAYSDAELKIMEDDIRAALAEGATGVVLGCARDGHLDEPATERLLACVRACRPNAQVTFHMAFDAIAADEQLAAVDWLAEHGVTRILTHGGEAGTDILSNAPRLRGYVARAADRIAILPGGGVSWQNAEAVAEAVGVSEVHGTKIVRL